MTACARAKPRSFVLAYVSVFCFFTLFLLDAVFIGLSFSSSLACAHIPVVSALGILDQEVRHNLAIFSRGRERTRWRSFLPCRYIAMVILQ